MLKTLAHALDPRADAISLLKTDHRAIEGLFEAFNDADDPETRLAIARKVCGAIEIHSKIEEKLLYPLAKAAVPESQSEVNEGIVEHSSIKRLVKEINGLGPDDEFFEAKMDVLQEYVRHHVAEEESRMFPKIVEGELDLVDIGNQMRAMKQKLGAEPVGSMDPGRDKRSVGLPAAPF